VTRVRFPAGKRGDYKHPVTPAGSNSNPTYSPNESRHWGDCYLIGRSHQGALTFARRSRLGRSGEAREAGPKVAKL